MVRHGAGIGILPCFFGDLDRDLRRPLPDKIDIRHNFWLVVHRDMRSVARVPYFMDWLTALVPNLQLLLEGKLNAGGQSAIFWTDMGYLISLSKSEW